MSDEPQNQPSENEELNVPEQAGQEVPAEGQSQEQENGQQEQVAPADQAEQSEAPAEEQQEQAEPAEQQEEAPAENESASEDAAEGSEEAPSAAVSQDAGGNLDNARQEALDNHAADQA